MDNQNDYTVKVTFYVNYHWGIDLMATSNQQEVTVNPKKNIHL